MIEKILFIYSEKNPLGDRQDRYDDVYFTRYDVRRDKSYVQRAIKFLMANECKVDCDCLHFCYEDGTSLFCEAVKGYVKHDEDTDWSWEAYEKTGLVSVTRKDERGNRDTPYLIDPATLRSRIYKDIDELHRHVMAELDNEFEEVYA